jgi:hypothetical protein
LSWRRYYSLDVAITCILNGIEIPATIKLCLRWAMVSLPTTRALNYYGLVQGSSIDSYRAEHPLLPCIMGFRVDFAFDKVQNLISTTRIVERFVHLFNEHVIGMSRLYMERLIHSLSHLLLPHLLLLIVIV